MTGQNKVISFTVQKNGKSAIDQINEFLDNPRIKSINIFLDGEIYIYFIKRNILNNIFLYLTLFISNKV
jgi:hypothetical protein